MKHFSRDSLHQNLFLDNSVRILGVTVKKLTDPLL